MVIIRDMGANEKPIPMIKTAKAASRRKDQKPLVAIVITVATTNPQIGRLVRARYVFSINRLFTNTEFGTQYKEPSNSVRNPSKRQP